VLSNFRESKPRFQARSCPNPARTRFLPVFFVLRRADRLRSRCCIYRTRSAFCDPIFAWQLPRALRAEPYCEPRSGEGRGCKDQCTSAPARAVLSSSNSAEPEEAGAVPQPTSKACSSYRSEAEGSKPDRALSQVKRPFAGLLFQHPRLISLVRVSHFRFKSFSKNSILHGGHVCSIVHGIQLVAQILNQKIFLALQKIDHR